MTSELYLDETKHRINAKVRKLDPNKLDGKRSPSDEDNLKLYPVENNQYMDKNTFLNIIINEIFALHVKYRSPTDASTPTTTVEYLLYKANLVGNVTYTLAKRSNFFGLKLVSKNSNEFSVFVIQVDDMNSFSIEERLIDQGNANRFKREVRLPKFRFDEYFNCHRKFVDEREIKGIYYDRKEATYNIIINRFFIRVKESDAIAKSQEYFAIDDAQYDRAIDMQFGSLLVSFEIMHSKWLKTVRNQSYLITNYNHDNVFELTDDTFRKNVFKQPIDFNRLVYCADNTLNVGENVYCFVDDVYYHFGPISKFEDRDRSDLTLKRGSAFSVKEIFASSPVNFSKQQLKLIFNYKDGQFVFMTQEYLYVFDYDRFYVAKDKQIRTTYKSNDTVKMIRNCFYGTCDDKHHIVTHGPGDHTHPNWKRYILFIALALIVLVILAGCYLVSRKRKLFVNVSDLGKLGKLDKLEGKLDKDPNQNEKKSPKSHGSTRTASVPSSFTIDSPPVLVEQFKTKKHKLGTESSETVTPLRRSSIQNSVKAVESTDEHSSKSKRNDSKTDFTKIRKKLY